MSVFSLRSQRNGQYKDFTLLEILHLLGDAVNDEIWLPRHEDVFNLSSFREINGSGTTAQPQNWHTEIFAQVQGQSFVSLQHIPAPPVLMVVLNGIVQSRYTDYQLNGNRLLFPFTFNAQDSLQCIYTY
ncbi:hypothetical protein CAP35_01230 [Chitinophagaceae bacterium IBVUCB1]|nr:hypothetical protein CAP35_01230 [Chitinophagaceae bacterium IBVUCB1]